MEGVIFKALSGFYYVDCGCTVVTCRARGKFRLEKITPLVGDRVEVEVQPGGEGTVKAILPRKNQFHRPASVFEPAATFTVALARMSADDRPTST